MKPREGEPLPKGHPHWKDVAELCINPDMDSLEDGYLTLIQDLIFMANEINAIIQTMTKNPLDVVQNPKPYLKDIQDIRNAFQKTDQDLRTLWNPNQIHPLGIAGSLSNPNIAKLIGVARSIKVLQAEQLKPLIQRFELAQANVEQLLKISEVFMNPNGPLISGTQGSIVIPGKGLVNYFERQTEENE